MKIKLLSTDTKTNSNGHTQVDYILRDRLDNRMLLMFLVAFIQPIEVAFLKIISSIVNLFYDSSCKLKHNLVDFLCTLLQAPYAFILEPFEELLTSILFNRKYFPFKQDQAQFEKRRVYLKHTIRTLFLIGLLAFSFTTMGVGIFIPLVLFTFYQLFNSYKLVKNHERGVTFSYYPDHLRRLDLKRNNSSHLADYKGYLEEATDNYNAEEKIKDRGNVSIGFIDYLAVPKNRSWLQGKIDAADANATTSDEQMTIDDLYKILKNTTVRKTSNSYIIARFNTFMLKAYEIWYKDKYSYAKDTYARKIKCLEQFEDNQYAPVGGWKAGILQHTRTRFVDDGKNDIRLFDVEKDFEDHESSNLFYDTNTDRFNEAHSARDPSQSSETKSDITSSLN